MFSAKRPALRRLWIIDAELRKKTYPTLTYLAEKAEVNEKTIKRDIQSMQFDHHAPVEYDRHRKGWAYTCDTYRLPAVVITEGELVAMFLAGQALKQAHGTPYEADLQRAIQKLAEFLPDEISLHWQSIEQAQSFHQTVTSLQDIDIFRQLSDAAIQHEQIMIRYWTASRDAESERLVDPYHLACIDGTWYLMAWCHQRNSVRTFAVSRVRQVTKTGIQIERPNDFQIGDYFDGTFKVISEQDKPLQLIRLRFAPSAAKYIREKVFHSSQRIEVHADQSVTLTMALRSLIEVRRWVLSFGAECVVLSPPELKDHIQQEARKMVDQSTTTQSAANQTSSSALEQIRKHIKSKPTSRAKKTG